MLYESLKLVRAFKFPKAGGIIQLIALEVEFSETINIGRIGVGQVVVREIPAAL